MKSVIDKNKSWIDSTWEKVDSKLSKKAIKSRNKLPSTSINGVHDDCSERPGWWTNGFWGGMMWLMYEATGNDEYKKTAERSEQLLDKAFEDFKGLYHDVGFMWHILSGANYRLTGSISSCNRNLYAAASLFSRYNLDGEFISAWNWECEDYSIIDSLMNITLLYWASDEIGHDRFKRIATKHMDMTIRDHIRPDGSVNHIVVHERDRVGVKEVKAGQGYSADSSWSRGVAWAVYGSIISYIHAGKDEYLEVAKRCADYFIEECKKTDYLPVIDFKAPSTPVLYDSTAGVITACGLLEIARYVSEVESKRYVQEAINLLKACDEKFCNYDNEEDCLVLMGSGCYPKQESHWKGVQVPIIYGDFFFVEALCKLKGRKFLIW